MRDFRSGKGVRGAPWFLNMTQSQFTGEVLVYLFQVRGNPLLLRDSFGGAPVHSGSVVVREDLSPSLSHSLLC